MEELSAEDAEEEVGRRERDRAKDNSLFVFLRALCELRGEPPRPARRANEGSLADAAGYESTSDIVAKRLFSPYASSSLLTRPVPPME